MFKVVKVTDVGLWLLFKHKEIITSDGCTFGGFWSDFPVFVKHEDMPLPEQDKRAIRWAKRLANRVEERELAEQLQNKTVQEFVNQIYASVIAPRREPSRRDS